MDTNSKWARQEKEAALLSNGSVFMVLQAN
jgi:hypothetical protein